VPWATLQHAANTVAAGDTSIIACSEYVGFNHRVGGIPDAEFAASNARPPTEETCIVVP